MPGTTQIMGILNVTEDSFSDGGKFFQPDQALLHAEEMILAGADIIDIGGESTRPGSEPITVAEEIKRTIPIIRLIRERFAVRISIDTSKYEVALAAIDAGASIINDVTALCDDNMTRLAADKNVDVILMHMQGTPRTMQVNPVYPGGVVSDLRKFFVERIASLKKAGVSGEKIWIDPGIGFGKTLTDNLELLRNLDRFLDIAKGIVVGTSRKSFLSGVLAEKSIAFELREAGTVASNLWAYQKGATIFRVHDVGQMKRALVTWQAIEGGRA